VNDRMVSAVPMVAALSKVAQARRSASNPAVAFVAGYLVVWAAFSAIATAAQWALQSAGMLSPMGSSMSRVLRRLGFSRQQARPFHPKKDPGATRYERLTHEEAIQRDLKVMDATAFALARENHMPIIVFSIREPGAIAAVLDGRGRATFVG